jgi:hypothetical protein
MLGHAGVGSGVRVLVLSAGFCKKISKKNIGSGRKFHCRSYRAIEKF